jgi:DNA modification methylase
MGGHGSGLNSPVAKGKARDEYLRGGRADSRPKSLLGLPWRIALALIDRGWILRADIVWSKPNGLPESVRGRVRRSHENIFHLTLRPDYFSAVDEIREPHTSGAHGASQAERTDARADEAKRWRNKTDETEGTVNAGGRRLPPEPGEPSAFHPLGRLPGSVWTIPSAPLIIPDTVKDHYGLPDHFAAYPAELCRRIILGWSPREVCSVCGEGRQPVAERRVEKWQTAHRQGGASTVTGAGRNMTAQRGGPGAALPRTVTATIVGYACACATPNAPSTPGFVVDPFAGTGTTVGVAHHLGRQGLGVDLSADYCRLARWRIESGHFARAEGKAWADRQDPLFA